MRQIHAAAIPYIDTSQMREVDRLMMDDYKIGLIQMMENAGRDLAHLARQRFLRGSPVGKRVAVMAGSGGNGGGALVAARWLHNWGATVHLSLGKPPQSMTEATRRQFEVSRCLSIPYGTNQDQDVDAFDLIVDGLIGYSLKGPPQGAIRELILWANDEAVPVLALDVPSGLDASTGAIHDPTISATATLTLALPKLGLCVPEAKARVGELYLADIGVPPELYESPGLQLSVGPLFSHEEIIRLW